MNPHLAVLFAALAEELSFGKAATKLHMSQPSLSAQIKKLEGQIGFKLYYRTPTGVVLTPAGQRLAPLAMQLAQLANALRDEVRAIGATTAVDTIVGSCVSSGDLRLLADMNETFIRDFPSSVLRIQAGATPELLTSLRRGELSLAIVLAPFDRHDLDAQLIASIQPHYLVPVEHPLSGKSELSPRMLKGIRVGVVTHTLHPDWFSRTMKPLTDAGALLQEAPDAGGDAIRDFARSSRTIVLRFSEADDVRLEDNLDLIPAIEIPAAEMHLVKLRNLYARGSDRYWRLALEKSRHQPAVAAQPHGRPSARR
jgi:DNA-binding transcriptional LysR family regulator